MRPVLLIPALAIPIMLSAVVFKTATAETPLSIVDRYGVDLAAYATVRRTDGTYRRMLISPEALGIGSGDALPDGTRILMETYYRPGEVSTVFHKQKVDGRWQYGSFPASRPNLSVAPRASCLACHGRASDTDFTFTLPSVWSAASGTGPSDFTCDRGGRSPCGSRVYLDGARQ